jgi:hypothetical protein
MAFMAALLAPFNYFTFYEPQPDVPTWAMFLVGFFDLILVLVVVGIVMTLVQQAKYGRARLAFRSFPFFLGDTLSARLGSSRPIGQFKKMTFTLRCIEERTETTRSAERRHPHRYATSSGRTRSCSRAGGARGQRGAVELRRCRRAITAPGLAEPPARYWELAVVADTPGLDFSAKFLVPIYASGREIPEQVYPG